MQVGTHHSKSRPDSDFVLSVLVLIMLLPCSSRGAGWEHISQFIAQATRAKDPFTKEDCIAKYQQIHAAPAGPSKIVAPAVPAAAPPSTKSAPERPSRREPRVREGERKRRDDVVPLCRCFLVSQLNVLFALSVFFFCPEGFFLRLVVVWSSGCLLWCLSCFLLFPRSSAGVAWHETAWHGSIVE